MKHIIWKDQKVGERTQFVADVLFESLFDYSFDSDRVPSLNLHYFCKDYNKTYSLVEDGIMREGNMTPLMEEFEYIVNKSTWLPCGMSKSLLYYKNNKGNYVDASIDKSLDSKNKSKFYSQSTKFLSGLLEADKDYFSLLVEEIEAILKDNSFTFEGKKKLFFCTRELLSELINKGVSKTHLYIQVKRSLFTNYTPDDDIEYVLTFLRSLKPNICEYETIFGITEEAYQELVELLVGLRVATVEEATALNTIYVAENKFKAYDPVSALRIAKKAFSAVLSVFNASKHDKNIRVTPNGMVRIVGTEQFRIINEAKGLLSKNKSKSRNERKKWLNTAIERPITSALISAFELHNTALEINDPQSQLLNIWTIFELLIETNQDFMNRINYIANILSSVLCNYYYERRIEALYNQIKKTRGVKEIIEQENRGKNSVQKLAMILKDNTPFQQQIKGLLIDYPFNVYKMEELALLFSSRKALKEDIERHSNRLRWQIMRIYRNRCMIIHNGDSFSQLSSVLENEHYYVDELFNYIFKKRAEGILEPDVIFTFSQVKEQEHKQLLNDKSPLSDDDFLSIIFDY